MTWLSLKAGLVILKEVAFEDHVVKINHFWVKIASLRKTQTKNKQKKFTEKIFTFVSETATLFDIIRWISMNFNHEWN